MNARDLLSSFTNENKNIAHVFDEHGGTSGIITLEDLIEEINKLDEVIVFTKGLSGNLNSDLAEKLGVNETQGVYVGGIEKGSGADKGGIIHCTIGKVNFDVNALKENIDCVLADLANMNLTALKYFPNKAGQRASKAVRNNLDQITALVKTNPKSPQLQSLLEKVGSHVIFLSEITQDKLKALNQSVKNIDNLKFLEIIQTQFQYFDTFLVSSAFMSGGGLSSFSGGYGGFGGGDFGGGGAIGDW